MKKILYSILLLPAYLVLFSCQKNQPVQFPIIQLPNGDSIKISKHVQLFYTFSSTNPVYLGPDDRLLIDSIPAAFAFYVDTAHAYITNNHTYVQYFVGKYFQNNTWRKGYIKADNLTNQFITHPADTQQVFLLGFEKTDSLNNYTCELRLYKEHILEDHHNFGSKFYPMEEWVTLKWVDSISSPKNIYLNVNFEYSGCGSSSDNYLFSYTNRLQFLLDYGWSSYDIAIDYRTDAFILVNEQDGSREIYDGKLTNRKYPGDVSAYDPSYPLFIKRYITEDVVDDPRNDDDHWMIKESIHYDLIYSFQHNRIILIDSIPYDSSIIYLHTWKEDAVIN
jgi:hypothetical protein